MGIWDNYFFVKECVFDPLKEYSPSLDADGIFDGVIGASHLLHTSAHQDHKNRFLM
jgi:hypothetical protein